VQGQANGLRHRPRAERVGYLRVTGMDNAWEQGKLEATKTLENRGAYPKSAARSIDWRFIDCHLLLINRQHYFHFQQ